LSASGGAGGPYQIAVTAATLPPGMAYDANTFTLSGTPTATGLFQIEVRVTDAGGHFNVQSLSIRIGNVLTITSPYRLVDGVLNSPYSPPSGLQLAATGTAPFTFAALVPPAIGSNPLPPGLSLSSSGVITGSPTTAGYYNFEVRAIDATSQQALKVLSINIPGA